MRYRRRVKLFPGVHLNFSKTGISTTIGIPGASINTGTHGTYLNTGIPRAGIYNRQKIGDSKKEKSISPRNTTPEIHIKNSAVSEIKSREAETTTSNGLNELKKTLSECYEEQKAIKKEIDKIKAAIVALTILFVLSYILIFGFFYKGLKNALNDRKDYLKELQTQLSKCFVDIDIQLDKKFESQYKEVFDAFNDLIKSQYIWDLTSEMSIDRKSTRSAAETGVTRQKVRFDYKNIEIIKSKYGALHLQNANGGDLYIYPAFIALVDSRKKFGLIDLRELEFNFYGQKFIEDETVPNDATVVGKTWAKVNKDGSRDKRFNDNFGLPVCKYGEMEFKSKTGLNEAYSISNYETSHNFSNKFNKYQKLIE